MFRTVLFAAALALAAGTVNATETEVDVGGVDRSPWVKEHDSPCFCLSLAERQARTADESVIFQPVHSLEDARERDAAIRAAMAAR